ncbi:MAG TPA: hypothetical protein VK436_02105 [Methanocella sp.]|nr:hypothetical protein [Methanocella sp.]
MGRKSRQTGMQKLARIAIPLFLVIIMLASAMYYCVNSKNFTGGNNSTPTVQFNSIVDGVKIAPNGADYIRYIDLNASPEVRNWAMSNLSNSLPNPDTFGAQPRKDMFVDYPMGYFGSYNDQWVMVTDFGSDFQNMNYSETTYQGVTLETIDDNYYTFSQTWPVISGPAQNVAGMVNFMKGGIGRNTSYDDYSDLFDQLKGYPINANQACMATVGTSSAFNDSDRYYAGITPSGDNFTYQAVLHMNRTLTDEEKATYKSRLEKAGIYSALFNSYQIQFQGDYMVLQATGNWTTCVSDMQNSWKFLKA